MGWEKKRGRNLEEGREGSFNCDVKTKNRLKKKAHVKVCID